MIEDKNLEDGKYYARCFDPTDPKTYPEEFTNPETGELLEGIPKVPLKKFIDWWIGAVYGPETKDNK